MSRAPLALFLTLAPTMPVALAAPSPLPYQACEVTSEFIETLRFLRTHPEAQIPEAAARGLADEVAKGCQGATERFKKTFHFLRKLGVSYKETFRLATQMAADKPEVQKGFLEILGYLYLSDYFDYDFHSALQTALDLAVYFKGDANQVRREFSRLAEFCVDQKKLGLPVPVCGQVARELTLLSRDFADGLFPVFRDLFDRLRKERGFGLSVKDALQTSLDVLRSGPAAPANFLKAYEFGIEKSGLNLPAAEALSFALKMAARTRPPPNAP